MFWEYWLALSVTGSVRGLAVPKVGILAACDAATRDAGTGINSTPELLPSVFARKRHRVKLHKACGLRLLFDCHKLNGLGRGLYDLIIGDVGLLIAPVAHKDVANFHFLSPCGFFLWSGTCLFAGSSRGFSQREGTPEFPAEKVENSKEERGKSGKVGLLP